MHGAANTHTMPDSVLLSTKCWNWQALNDDLIPWPPRTPKIAPVTICPLGPVRTVMERAPKAENLSLGVNQLTVLAAVQRCYDSCLGAQRSTNMTKAVCATC